MEVKQSMRIVVPEMVGLVDIARATILPVMNAHPPMSEPFPSPAVA
jgi:hypothetical protein